MNEEVKGARSKNASNSSRGKILTIRDCITNMGLVIAKVQGKVDNATYGMEVIRSGMEEL